jgi:ethanolamine utilization protein EutN
MQIATVTGHATSTVKHRSFDGWRLLIVQPLDVNGEPDTDPAVAIDRFGAGSGQTVILNSDGHGARQYIGDEKSPVRWFVIGIVDEKR